MSTASDGATANQSGAPTPLGPFLNKEGWRAVKVDEEEMFQSPGESDPWI